MTLVLAATTLTRDDEDGRRRVQLSDVAAIGAAVAVVVGLSRGALDPGTVSGGDTVLLLDPPRARLLRGRGRSGAAARPGACGRPSG